MTQTPALQPHPLPPPPRHVVVAITLPHIVLRVLQLIPYLFLAYIAPQTWINELHSPHQSWFILTTDPIALSFAIWMIYTMITGRFYHAPKSNRRLCETGIAIEGRYTGIRRSLGPDSIWYSFTHPITHEKIERVQTIYSRKALAQLSVGDPITILYDATNPKNSTVYETCGYDVIHNSDTSSQ